MEQTPPKDSGNPQEFHRYRKALLLFYVTLLTLGSLLVLTSVLYDLFWRHGPRATQPDATDLRTCNEDVRELFESLGRKTAELELAPVTGDPTDLGGRWDRFAKEWDAKWEDVRRRCRFDDLVDTGLGPTYDRMAWVHRQLPPMKLRYRELMKRFTVEQAGELQEMREALDKSRALLDQGPAVAPSQNSSQDSSGTVR